MDKVLFAKQLGGTIAQYRQQAGLTQEQLAERLGIGNEAVSRIERGVAMPSLLRLFDFAVVFECSVAELLSPNSPREEDELYELQALLDELDPYRKQLAMRTMKSVALGLLEQQHQVYFPMGGRKF